MLGDPSRLLRGIGFDTGEGCHGEQEEGGHAGRWLGVRCDQGGRSGLRYTFEIHGDRSWVIFKINDKGLAALAQGSSSAIRDSDAVNSVSGECRELATGATRLVMEVNNEVLSQTTDEHAGQRMSWHGALVMHRDRSSPVAEARFTRFRTFDTSDLPR